MIRRNPLVESFAPRPKDLWNQKCHTQKLIFLLFGYRVPKGCIKRYPLEPSLVGTTTLRCPNSRNHSWGDRRRPMEYIDPTDCWLHFTIYVIHDVYILHYVSKCIMCIYIYTLFVCLLFVLHTYIRSLIVMVFQWFSTLFPSCGIQVIGSEIHQSTEKSNDFHQWSSSNQWVPSGKLI